MHARAVLAIVPLVSACGLFHPYAPGRLVEGGDIDRDAVRSGPCVDMGVALQGRGDISPLFLVAKFGNRCHEPALVDFGRIAIDAEWKSASHPAHLYDPRGEIVPLHVEIHTMGIERVRIVSLDDTRARRVCVHVGDAIGAPNAQPVCFVPSGESSWEIVR